MKKIKKTAIFILSTVLLLFIGVIVIIDLWLPELPPNVDKTIERALDENNYQLQGDEGYAVNDSTVIWFETIHPDDTILGHIVLVMGIANDALAWPDYFIDSLVVNGYNVIIFDTRGTGKTDWILEWTRQNAYSLEDIADDIDAILDTLNIDRANIIGISFGGMIAQTFAINYPERTKTLVSISSSGYIMDNDLPGINLSVIARLLLANIRYNLFSSIENSIKLQLISRAILSGKDAYDFDIKAMTDRLVYNLTERNGFNPNASKQHTTATELSGSRYEKLTSLKSSTLIIHGLDDPLIPLAHSKKLYSIIPHSDTLWVDGMGHDIPKSCNPALVKHILKHLSKN